MQFGRLPAPSFDESGADKAPGIGQGWIAM